MPSLQQLEEFVTTFKNLGNELGRLLEARQAYDLPPLPDTEPPSPFPDELSGIAPAAGDTGFEAGAPETASEEPGPGDFSLDNLLDDIPDLGVPPPVPVDDILGSMGELTGIPDFDAPPDDTPAETAGEAEDILGDTGEFDPGSVSEEPSQIPEDLLSGFADDLEPDGLSDGLPSDDSTGADLEDLSGLSPDSGGEGEAAESLEGSEDFSGDDASFDLGNFDTPSSGETEDGESGEGSLDLGGEDLGGESFDLGGEGFELGTEGIDGDLGGETSEGEVFSEAGTSDTGNDFGGIEGIEGLGIPEAPAEESDSFDNFTSGEESQSSETEESGDAIGSAEDFGSDFSLEGFDDIGKPDGKAGAKTAGPAAAEEVEEINLKEEEFRRLEETLSGYPLNLRIACEQIISEEAVTPKLMASLVQLLVRGAPARETARLAGKILGRTIPIPKGFAKQTGAELEAEQASFGYIFAKKFVPILRIFVFFALVAFSLGYLAVRFIINPLRAENIYKDGYERIAEGDYNRANDLFLRAFDIHPVKNWFYRYAEAFRDVRNYQAAERKYDELLRVYPRDKKGALDYAYMESHFRKNYEKANRIIRTNITDYNVDDREGLTALAENNLEWGAEQPERYEDARAAYARLIAKYGRQDPFLEGMLKFFIRTDNLTEVLPLQAHFMSDPKKRKISVAALAELGGYLLDKRFEDVRGVPDEYSDRIEGIHDVLLRAIKADPGYPESYYHLARYYNKYGSLREERATLENAIKIFDAAPEENAKRAAYRVGIHRLYGEVLIKAGEFFPAANQLARGIRLYEDARTRGVLVPQPEFGRLYADIGDLTFFGQDGNMAEALRYYTTAEANLWSPPEVQYRMGVAHYELQQWENALDRFFMLSGTMPNNRRLLYALGNASYLRGNYFAAQGYYNKLMDLLDADRVRFPNLSPGGRQEEQDFAERIMVADNNLGVTLEALTRVTGDTGYRSRALGLFSESIRAWDVLTRDPDSMTRMRPISDLYGPGINLAYLNAQNILHPVPNYDQQIFMRIDRDMNEPSDWELLIPRNYRLSENLYGVK